MADFFDDEGKRAVREAVAAVEAQTGAEVVVAVRRAVGFYRHAEYLGGALCALGVLTLLLFHPRSFAVATMPLDVVVVFALGALATSHSPTLRRLLSSRRLQTSQVSLAARAAFVDLGVSRTRARGGVLVFVALEERSVEVIADVGLVDGDRLGAAWQQAIAAMAEALDGTPDLARFVAALRTLGPALAVAMPRAADDVNELSDELA